MRHRMFDKKPAIVRASSLGTDELTEAQMAHWRFRSIIATGGNHTHLGRIMLRILNVPSSPPCFQLSSPAIISLESIIGAFFCHAVDVPYQFVVVCTVQQYADDLRRLCHDTLKLSGQEACEVFNEARMWIGKDMRATSTGELRK